MYLRLGYDSFFFFFNDTATTEIYTLSLHDALPIYFRVVLGVKFDSLPTEPSAQTVMIAKRDRKSTRLNSSHANISYAVFCLKKKNKPANSSCRHEQRSALDGNAHSRICSVRQAGAA